MYAVIYVAPYKNPTKARIFSPNSCVRETRRSACLNEIKSFKTSRLMITVRQDTSAFTGKVKHSSRAIEPACSYGLLICKQPNTTMQCYTMQSKCFLCFLFSQAGFPCVLFKVRHDFLCRRRLLWT